MPIDFSCPSCRKSFRVKDELAGKAGKCSQCGHRIQIPQPEPLVEALAVAADGDLGNWLDDELKAPQPVRSAPPAAQPKCQGCGAPVAASAKVCLLCGCDPQSGAQRAKFVETSDDDDGKPGRKGNVATLLRGAMLSAVFALVGAVLWAVVAWLTNREFGILAWALGGMAGFGMALGHEDDDGTTAGIIAAFMSLFGIVAAKAMIVVIVIAALVAGAVRNGGALALTVTDEERERVADQLAHENLASRRLNRISASDGQWRQALAQARVDVEKMSPEELHERLDAAEGRRAPVAGAKALAGADEAESDDDEANNTPPAGQGPAGDETVAPAARQQPFQLEVAEANAAADDRGLVALFFQEMFHPIDGLFILFAFFTAYKVGSGKRTD